MQVTQPPADPALRITRDWFLQAFPDPVAQSKLPSMFSRAIWSLGAPAFPEAPRIVRKAFSRDDYTLWVAEFDGSRPIEMAELKLMEYYGHPLREHEMHVPAYVDLANEWAQTSKLDVASTWDSLRTAEYQLRLMRNFERDFHCVLVPERIMRDIFDYIEMRKPKFTEDEIARRSKASVYLIGDRAAGVYKIGVAINPKQRLKQLKSGSSYKLSVIAAGLQFDAFNLEKQLHREFNAHRLHGEWFALSDEQVADIVYRLEHPRTVRFQDGELVWVEPEGVDAA